MLWEWNTTTTTTSTIAAILFALLAPSAIPSNSIRHVSNSNDGDVLFEFQQTNNTTTSISSSPLTTTTATTPTAPLLRPSSLTQHAMMKKAVTRSSGRKVVPVNRTVPETCQQVMAVCNDGPKQTLPVCDNMNQTHRTPCSLALFSCKRRSLHFRILVHVGPCNINSPVFTFEEEVCPTKCSQKNSPVCDSRQKTYRNLCTFQKLNCMERKKDEANASFLYALMACNQSSTTTPFVGNQSERPVTDDEQIRCPKRGSCSSVRRPVCDSNGRWHRNQCTFLRAQCIAMRSGKRLSLADERRCSTNSAEKKEVKKGQPSQASRRCYRRCAENLPYQPICATTFVTYPNRCLFLNARCRDRSLEQLYYGECRDCLISNCNKRVAETESDSNFVCDQAGRTKRKCEFEMLRCIYERKFGYNITAAYTGRCCPTEDTCEEFFDGKGQLRTEGAVCDSRNVTHLTRCHFEVHKCREEKIAHRSLTLVNENGGCLGTSSSNDNKLPKDGDEAVECSNSTECDDMLNYEPICGTDGTTYVNRCRLIRARCVNRTLLAAYSGECCINRCERHWAPVCDNRNVTHSNLCVFSMRNCIATRRDGQPLSVASYTACPNDACSVQCNRNDYQPVCASNGVTYQNECELNNAICGLGKEFNRWDPMGSKEMKLELDYRGECCREISAKCNDSDNLSPICDSEGHTHNNICEYERMACLSRKRFQTNLTIRYWGECCVDDCQQQEQSGLSLCDNTQTTHDNWCKFRLAQCESHRRNNRTLQMAYMGECCTLSPSENCTDSGPVCDTDGTTHSDFCTFRHKQCIMNRTQQKLIKIAYYGECCSMETDCNDDWSPVCDQHGIIYPNRCYFHSKKCLLEKTSNVTILLRKCH